MRLPGVWTGRAQARVACAPLLAVALLVAPTTPPAARAQGALSALQTDVDQIVQRSRPSVLTVFAQSTATRELAGARGASRVRTRVGSGVAIENDVILTTASVVLDATRVVVRTANGIQVEARIVGIDPIFNVALLEAPEVRVPPLRFAEGHHAQIGDWVIALGTSYRAQPTESVGNVAYAYRDPRLPLLQLTNTVYPGNSGGAALNVRGELVGIVQGELGAPEFGAGGDAAEHRPSGSSFVLPAETVGPIVRTLRREGRVRHGYLGVTTQAASVESESEQGVRVPLGALVEGVVVQGPAALAGLRRGDLVVGFDGERVEYPEQLARWVAATAPGVAVDLVWARSGIRHERHIVLGESPTPVPEWVMGPPVHGDEQSPSRIADLEKRIQKLNRELTRLKEQGGNPRR